MTKRNTRKGVEDRAASETDAETGGGAGSDDAVVLFGSDQDGSGRNPSEDQIFWKQTETIWNSERILRLEIPGKTKEDLTKNVRKTFREQKHAGAFHLFNYNHESWSFLSLNHQILKKETFSF